MNAMVVTSIKPRLSTPHDSDDGRDGEWGTLQIATPAIVGGVLLLLFAAYFVWQRKLNDKRPYNYHSVRSDWVSNMQRIFSPFRRRRRVLPSHDPVTLDESMRLPGLAFDFDRGLRQNRSNSSDSRTPLTSTNYAFDYPPSKDYISNKISGSPPPPPIPRRRTIRWWWFFGSRPRQVKSEEPSQRWRIDSSDGSSSGHGHSSHGHQYTVALEPLREDVDGEDEVIQIGDNAVSVASTPMIQHFPAHVRSAREMPAVPEHPPSSGARTPASVANVLQNDPGTPVSSANRGLPPSYDVSQSHKRYQSTEDTVWPVRPGPYMGFPPPIPVAAAGYPSPRVSHGRGLSSDSFLATQPPMIATSIY